MTRRNAAALRRWVDDQPVLRGAAALWREVRDDRVTGLAAEVAFFALLSVFPTLLALVAALGSLEVVVGDDLAAEAEAEVLAWLERILTSEASGTMESARELFESSNTGILTFAAVGAVWTASRGFGAVVRALDLVYDLDERRSWVRQKLVALGLALGTVVVAALVLAAIVVGPLLGTGRDVADLVGLGDAFATGWDLARWPAVGVALVVWATTVLHLAPNHRTPWRDDLPGALVAAGSWALLSLGLRGYLEVAAGGNAVIGALGGQVIVVIWLYLLALGLLVGGEVNALLAARRFRNSNVVVEGAPWGASTTTFEQ